MDEKGYINGAIEMLQKRLISLEDHPETPASNEFLADMVLILECSKLLKTKKLVHLFLSMNILIMTDPMTLFDFMDKIINTTLGRILASIPSSGQKKQA